MQLKDAEEIRSILRQHIAVLFAPLLTALFFLVLPFFLLFFLFSFGLWGVAIFVILLMLGIVLAIRTIVIWGSNALVITNKRLVHVARPAFFSRHVSETPLTTDIHVSWKRHGLFQTIFRAGTVFVQGTKNGPELVFKDVSDPKNVSEFIQELREKHKQPDPDLQIPDSEEVIPRIISLLEELDEKDLSVVERKLKKRVRQTALDAVMED